MKFYILFLELVPLQNFTRSWYFNSDIQIFFPKIVKSFKDIPNRAEVWKSKNFSIPIFSSYLDKRKYKESGKLFK